MNGYCSPRYAWCEKYGSTPVDTYDLTPSYNRELSAPGRPFSSPSLLCPTLYSHQTIHKLSGPLSWEYRAKEQPDDSDADSDIDAQPMWMWKLHEQVGTHGTLLHPCLSPAPEPTQT